MRQFGCIEITRTDALLMRDAIRPLAKVDPFEPRMAMQFCEKLYNAILKMKAHELDTICVPLEEQEVFFINQFISNDDWGTRSRSWSRPGSCCTNFDTTLCIPGRSRRSRR